jgi:hypothetical protein
MMNVQSVATAVISLVGSLVVAHTDGVATTSNGDSNVVMAHVTMVTAAMFTDCKRCSSVNTGVENCTWGSGCHKFPSAITCTPGTTDCFECSDPDDNGCHTYILNMKCNDVDLLHEDCHAEFGAAAAKELETAVESGDAEAIADVAYRYPSAIAVSRNYDAVFLRNCMGGVIGVYRAEGLRAAITGRAI